MMLNIKFSRRLAILGGIALPMLETIRRWREWPGPPETWLFWMDDYLLGAFLLWAAWMNRPRVDALTGWATRRASWLTAAFGFGCGLGFGSAVGQWNTVLNQANPSDPSGLHPGWVIAIKCAMVAVGVVGMVASMRDVDLRRASMDDTA